MSKTKHQRPISFRRQMRQSMDELRSIMARGQSPTADGRLTVRTVEVVEPSAYDAKAVRRTRRSLNLSQALFAQLLGVSGALVRAWELGSRAPAPLARRLLDQVRASPGAFTALVRASATTSPRRHRPVRRSVTRRSKMVA
jgi:DNA-binding transcriptional regulator YiaG